MTWPIASTGTQWVQQIPVLPHIHIYKLIYVYYGLYEKKKFGTRSMEKLGGIAFDFCKMATAVKKLNRERERERRMDGWMDRWMDG